MLHVLNELPYNVTCFKRISSNYCTLYCPCEFDVRLKCNVIKCVTPFKLNSLINTTTHVNIFATILDMQGFTFLPRVNLILNTYTNKLKYTVVIVHNDP